MRSWALLLSGLIIWAVHFFALYAIASIFLTTPLARALTLLLTLICVALAGWIFVRVLRIGTPTAMDEWMRAVALCGLGLGGLAMMWLGLPALLV